MTCEVCKGIGLVDKTQDGEVFGQEVCSACQGTGVIGEAPIEEKPVKVTKKHK